jgi:hypothetical protein
MMLVLHASDYNTLILLEFENTSQSKEYDDLRHKLPDLIKESILLNNNINIEYAGKIEPYLGISNSGYDEDALLLLGKFSIEGMQANVSLELYDLSTWNKVSRDFYFCSLSNPDCFVYELDNYTTNLLPLYFSGDKKEHDIENTLSDSLNSIEYMITDDLFLAIDNFAVEAELNYSWDKISDGGSQYGNRYYKDIDKDNKNKLISNSREKNTEKLISYFNKIILNPYDVIMQDIKMEYDQVENGYVNLTVPVTYTVKKNLIEDMLTTLPHLSTSHSIGNLVIKFFDSDFIISDYASQYSFMKYQVVPVLFLSDDIGRINYVYVDDLYGASINDFNSDIFAASSSKFYPLFAITPGNNNIQINLDMNSLDIEYNFRLSIDNIEKYSKVAIKFLHQIEIESIINQIYVSDE